MTALTRRRSFPPEVMPTLEQGGALRKAVTSFYDRPHKKVGIALGLGLALLHLDTDTIPRMTDGGHPERLAARIQEARANGNNTKADKLAAMHQEYIRWQNQTLDTLGVKGKAY